MKKIFKNIIIFIITLEAKLVLSKFKPKIIAITGNVGKTSAKDAIFSGISNSIHVRKNQKSFNSEIGVPLTILGLDNGYKDFFKWISNIFEGLFVLFKKEYPEWLVLEFGVDRPGDMERLIKWIKVDIAVFTRFPDVPVHVEYFSSPEDVAVEKKKLIHAVKEEGYVILNADDPKVFDIKKDLKRKVLTFGIENVKDSDITASNSEITHNNLSQKVTGINFKVNYKDNSIPVNLKGILGDQFIYPALASFCCGVAMGISVIEIADSLKDYKPAPGRMNILDGINDSIIIDDSYNASPVAMEAAVRTLAKIQSKNHKIVVLGDMSEIGKYTASAHKMIGSLISELKIDFLFTLGKRSEYIAEEAILTGTDKENIFSFSEYGELTKKLKEFIKEGTVVLVKGSQTMRMERIVKEIIKDKENLGELLVRQDDFWSTT